MARQTKKTIEQSRVASTRAAEIFGAPDSLFTGRARVTAKGLAHGLEEMVRRVYQATPGVAPWTRAMRPPIRLTFIGTTAKASYTVVSLSPLRVDGVINLPAMGDEKTLIARSVADQYTAYTLHELMHMLYTPLGEYRSAIWRLTRKHGLPEATVAGYVNAIEDVVIERAGLHHAIAPGAREMLRALLAKCVADVPANVYGTAHAFGVTLAFGLRGYAPSAQRMVEALPPALRSIYDDAARMLATFAPRAVGAQALTGTEDVADMVLGRLSALAQATPPQPSPQGEPGEGTGGDGEPGEGTGGDGEPGEGTGGDGEPAEPAGGDGEPGEGTGGDGEPGEGTGGDGEPAEPAGGDGEPGEGTGGDGEPAEPAGGDGEPAEGTGDANPTSRDIADALRHGGISPDMQPDAPDNVTPSDGAAGVAINSTHVVKLDDGTPDQRHAMQRIAQQVLGTAPRVAQGLRKLLDASAYDTKEGGRRSGSLRVGALSRAATGLDTVFERRTYRDGSDAAVTLLIDQSSSMCGNRIDAARDLAAALSHLLSQCAGTTFECLGFHSSGGRASLDDQTETLLRDAGESAMVRSYTQRAVISVFKTFKDTPAVGIGRLAQVNATGGTPDAAAIRHACDSLAKSPANRRIFIMIADGEGSTSDVLGRILRRYEGLGIICIGIGVQMEPNEAFTHRVKVSNVSKLGASGLAALLTAVARDHEYHGGGDD